MEIIRCLEQSEIVKEFKIQDFKLIEHGFYLKILAILINNTELYIREYSDSMDRSYSYHWQGEDKKLIMRWDNAPHHKRLESYPHHVHVGEQVSPNLSISCSEILKIIEKKILKSNPN
ncbi:MAG: DUF6516 family protein [bacterium]